MKTTSPLILTPQQWTNKDVLASLELRGKRRNAVPGSWVSDLAELKKSIVLCGSCQGKFDWRHHQYFSVRHYEHQPVHGYCDGCGVYIHGRDGRLFIHEDIRPAALVTKDESRSRMKTFLRLAHTR